MEKKYSPDDSPEVTLSEYSWLNAGLEEYQNLEYSEKIPDNEIEYNVNRDNRIPECRIE